MAVGTGIGLNISQLDAAIKKADEALESLGKTGEKTSKQINEAFSLAKNGNIQDFISVIERLSNTLNKKGYNQAAQMVREIATETTGAIDMVNRFTTLMQTITDGGRSNVKNGAIESLKYQIDEALSRLGVLNERLQFYTKGEGAKAVNANVVDTSALQDEANKLRVVVELLQRRLEHEQALAALKRRSDSILIQRERDMDWQEMETERTESLQRQSILAKEANMAFEQSYNERYQMYAVMFDKMWQKDLENFERQNASAKSGSQKYATEYEERQRYYEQWINQSYLQEQERTQEEARQANERAKNSLASYQQELREKERFYRDWINKNYAEEERRRKKEEATSYEGAIRTSDNAITLAQEIQAIKNLEAARAKLSKTDSDYQKKLDELNKKIRTHNENIKRATSGAKELENAHSELGSKLATVFSAQAIIGYINKMIKVRGELELQQKALQAMLQDKDKANEVWQKTIDLAVQSPFRINHLVSYTKQLAAYRIESDKLFETNKMLADISAGLGVDMQRLILAFGQVRSATYLRGTELRQFTEAGIPILEQLALYFTELEGRAVSVGDVFERVSKRMVSFADVEEIFKRMTSEGGTFYRMQEIQAETLQGQISNLKDSVDIMLNDIGKANENVLKSSLAIVRTVVQNWRILSVVIQQASIALVGFTSVKIIRALRLSGDALEAATIKAKGLTAAVAKLKLSMLNLSKAMKTNPYIFAAAAAAAAIHALVQYGKAVDAMNEKYNEMSQRELRRVDNLKELNKQVKKNNKEIKDGSAAQKAAEEGTTEYANAEDSLSKARGKNIALLDKLKKEYPEVYASIVVQKDGTIDLTKAIEEQNKVAMRQISLQQQAKGGWFHQDFSTNYKDAVDALGQYGGALEDVKMEAYRAHQRLVEALDLGEITKDSYDSMVGLIDQLKSAKDLSHVRDILKQLNTTINSSDDLSFKFTSNIQQATQRLSDSFVDYSVSLSNVLANIKNMGSTISNVVNEQIALDPQKGKEKAKEYIDKVLAEFGVLNQTVKEWAREEIVKIIGVKLEWGKDEGGSNSDKLTEEWAKRVEKAITEVNDKIKSKSKGLSDIDLFPVPKAGQTKEQYLALAKDVIEIAEMTYKATQKIEDEAAVNRTKALAPYAKEVRDILNLIDKPRGSGKDYRAEKLKNQINLIKEMNAEYEKLTKTFSKSDSASKVLDAYAKTAKKLGLDISKMDFSDEGTIVSLDRLLGDPKYAADKYALEIQKALDNYQVEIDIERKKKNDKALLDDVQKLFDQYDLSLELKNLNIPPDLAKSLFNVDYLNLDGLKKAVQDQSSKFIGTDMDDEYKDFLDKITDMENKATRERMETYVEYARSTIGERAKIKLEELKKLKEIEEAFAEKEGDSEKTKQYKKEQKQLASEKARKESRDAMQKLEWEDFQKSDMFINIFEDLDGASDALLNHMIQKLQEFKNEWTDMPLEDMKNIVDKINELQMALVENNPWEAYKKSKDVVKYAMREAQFESDDAKETFGGGKNQHAFMQALQLENVYQEQKKLNAQKELGYLETALRIKEGQATEEEKILGKQKDYNKYLRMSPSELKKQITVQKTIVKNAEDILVANEDTLTESQKQEKALLKQSENLGKAQQMANDLYDAFSGLAEALGADSDSPAAIFADMGMNMLNTVLNTIQLQIQLNAATVAANGLGIAMNTAMGVIGWIVMGVQLLTQAITALAKIRDNKIVDQLEKQAAVIEKQREEYEKIEKKVESAYNVDRLREYNAEMKRSVELEIQALEASIALEKSRKNVDEEQLKDYEKQIAEARERLTESTQDMVEELNGIFDLSDFTSGFIDAWWDAMDEGKKGLDALNEHFNETMKDMVKKQALYRGAQEIMSQVQNAINKSLEGDFSIDEAEWQAIMDAAKKANVNLDEFLQGWYDMFGAMSDSAGGSLSELQKGIQGITEETAQIIEAYLNSIRGYMSEQVTYIKNISRIFERVSSRDGVNAIQVRMIS